MTSGHGDGLEWAGVDARDLAQLRARATLKELGHGAADGIHWTYDAAHLLRSLVAIHVRLAREARDHPETPEGMQTQALGAARAWESLARLGEGLERSSALVNSAIEYEIAGYQANAACLARIAVPATSWTVRPTMAVLTSAFLQRKFLRLRIAAELLVPPPTLELDPESMLGEAARSVVSLALSDAALHMISGDPTAYSRASEGLGLAYDALAAAGFAADANLTRGLRAVLSVMKERSTWRVLADVAPGNPRWTRYLRSLARGLATPITDARSISELWPSQMAAVENGLFESGADMVVRMPTSAGKTRVAEMAIVHQLATDPGARALYVAPYRALVTELSAGMAAVFTDLGMAASTVVGSYEQDELQQLTAKDDRLLIVTPEKLDMLFRSDPDVFGDIRLVVLDEGHVIADQSRGAGFDLLVARLRRRFANARFLMLSAVVPDQTIEDFTSWLNSRGDGAYVVDSSWRPSLQRTAALHWRRGHGRLEYPRQANLPGAEFVPNLVQERVFQYRHRGTQRLRSRRFPRDSKSEVTAALAYEVAPLGPLLIFCTQTTSARACAQALLDRLDLGTATDEQIPSVFDEPGEQGLMPVALAVAEEWLGTDSLVARLLRRRIGLHHGRLPDAVREAIEEDARARRLAIVVATSTLAQGVNLPVRTVVIHSTWRMADSGRMERIPARDYWNMAGRAGRAGEETEGTVIHVVVTPADARDYAHYLARRNRLEPVESGLFKLLRDLAARRLSAEALSDQLDAGILAMMVEEGDEDFASAVEAVLGASLCSIQAGRAGIPIEPLAQAIVSGAADIGLRVPEASWRRAYSVTGLASKSCQAIRDHILAHEAAIAPLLSETDHFNVRQLSELLLQGMRGVREMARVNAYVGDATGLIDRWIAGESIRGILQTAEEDTAASIEDFLTVDLPWGTSSYLSLAAPALDIQLSRETEAFPSMLKYGAASPEAAWSHAAGIRSRVAARALSVWYRREHETGTARQYRAWLRALDPEELERGAGISSSLAASAARELVRSRRNDLIDRLEEGTLFPLSVRISGTQGLATALANTIRTGAPVQMERNYTSTVNRNAVRLTVGRQPIGDLPWAPSQVIGLDLDAGVHYSAEIAEVDAATGSLLIVIRPL